MSVTLERDSYGNYDILVDGELVGGIEAHDQMLMDIDVSEENQRKGYGTAAVRQFVEHQRTRGAEVVETSAVVSEGMRKIVTRLGFEPREDDPSRYHLRLD